MNKLLKVNRADDTIINSKYNKTNSFSTTSNGFILFDADKTISFINEEARNLLKLDVYPMKDQHILSIFQHDISTIIDDHIDNVIKENRLEQFDLMISEFPVQWMRFMMFPSQTMEFTLIILDISDEYIKKGKISETQEINSIINETAMKLNKTEKPKELLDSLFHRLSSTLDLDFYFNYLWNKKDEKLHLMNYYGISEAAADRMRVLAKGEAICGIAASKMTSEVMEHVDQSDDRRLDLLKSIGIKAYACEPLISNGKLVGTLSFGSKKRGSFTQEELDLIHTISQQVTLALYKISIVEEMTHNTNSLQKANIHLMQNEKNLRDIFEGAQVGIIILDNEGNIVDTNPAACSILGISEEECKSLQVKKFVSDSNEIPIEVHWSNLLTLGKTNSDEYMIHRPDQTERIISFSASKDIYHEHHMIIFHDITLQKSIEQSLINEKNVAEKSNRTKTNFLAMISHELRTPLNSIIGFAQILDDDKKDPLTPKQEYRLGKILYSSKHLLQLINNILELVRIDSKPEKADNNNKPVNVKDAIHDCIQMVKNNASEKAILVSVEEDLEDVTILVDPIRFQQVVVNLLANAIKYNKQEGSVSLYWKVTGHYLALFVKDTGIGIPQELQEKIFEPFYRIFHEDFNIEGTGIGLTLVKQNVLEMKGTVGVCSQEHAGSTFWVKIPI
ncbi:PAS domain S-box protein [Bacillus tianshenii]|uniref:sensor histidine kinase n=1 Tax=Sutcliffiella tianshenii TaxID=1463404 RepID=UPI001CD319D9|nr:ATP-binding protein [Bacillus tianshenii]MCA1321826.1 PAS domain S-box protein [Bacillus tianshenii]